MPNIREVVAEQVANIGPRTRAAVVEHFANIEAQRQATALITGLDKLTGAERELQKIRPQNTAFDEAGQPVGPATFTKQQVDDRKKLAETIDKLQRAINKADENNDFGDLYNLTK